MNDYPESIPQGISSITTFPFSFEAGRSAKKDLEVQLENVNDRINKIVDHFVYSDVPILSYVLRLTTKKSDLKKMSKALDRLADLVKVQEQLESRLSVIRVVEADPTWLTSTFSDYSSEIDSDIISIFDQE